MKRWCIVPARAGSKRLPGKNKKILAGKPLICHTIDVVHPHFDRVLVTTDDPEIINLETQYYEERVQNISFVHRPAALCLDTSKVIDTVRYYVTHYSDELNPDDQIWLCLPTCPLRTEEDVQKVFESLGSNECASIVSVTDFEFPPELAITTEFGFKEKNENKPFANDNTRSQDFIPTYRPNGAFYGCSIGAFMRVGNFFKPDVRAYHMPRERSVDVDTEFDFQIAEMVLEQRKKKHTV